ncbi:hypothetical protein PR202_gb25565 [Eleusine coracana subsp. coracana]|uniref:BTB domain-containing protein n=1 Tax=Eleusine coracana subsp. coracana TaxID=191504 RepID=A0AAV5FPH6_ELECO|nr:hypothetical protein PR202_gb25565 [Eleusine coracana subsp. coracana]
MVLAARSLLLKKELNWPNPGPPNYVINVTNMDPEVFESLLHFIYTDAMPDMGQLNDDRRKERIGYLLFAAQTYGLDRLKVICEDILSRNREVETVCNVLLRVYQYNCNRVKDACIDFIISDNWGEVAKTEGYKHLKTNSPSILIEILEKGRKLDNK